MTCGPVTVTQAVIRSGSSFPFPFQVIEWSGSPHLPQHLASLLLRDVSSYLQRLPGSHRICAVRFPIPSPVPLQITASPPSLRISSVINKSFSSFSWKAAALCYSSLPETCSVFLRLFLSFAQSYLPYELPSLSWTALFSLPVFWTCTSVSSYIFSSSI